jgi:putative ABC transport system permease protein
VRSLISRLLDIVLRRRREDRLSEEIQAHLDLMADDYVAQGMSPADARLAARREFGGVDQTKMRYRDQRGLPLIDALTQDVRFALRVLARDRGFALTAIVVLAVGIGVNNMFFTLVYAHKFRGLAIERPDRVLSISMFDDRAADRLVSLPDLEDLRAEQRSFQGLAAYTTGIVTIGDEGRAPDRYSAAYLSANALVTIGVTPIAGRGPEPREDRPGAEPVVLLGAQAWHSRYGGDPAIVGRTIQVNGAPATVVGIIPERSGFPSGAAVWLPLGQWPGMANLKREARSLRVIGRLRDGVRGSDAEAEIQSIAGRLERVHPDTNRNVRVRVMPINERLLGTLDGWLPFISAGLIVILVACANVANLMMARAMSRGPELAIRTSLGASRFRLIRQLVVESMVLAGAGATIGLGVSLVGVRLFSSAIPEGMLPYWFEYSMDQSVLAALIVTAFASAFVFGLIPALQASKTDVNRTLKDGNRGTGRGLASRAWTAGFLTAELALAILLVTAIGRGNLTSRPVAPADATLRTAPVLTAAITLPASKYPGARERDQFFRQLEERVLAQPGIVATSLTTSLPVPAFTPAQRRIDVEGQSRPDNGPAPALSVVEIGSGYFETLGLPLTRGRAFSDQDGAAGQPAAIVNERFVEMFLRDEEPLGRRVAASPLDAAPGTAREWRAIVGVAPATRDAAYQRNPVIYLPVRGATPASVTLMVRSENDPAALASLLREEARAIDSNVPLYQMQALAATIHDATWGARVSNYLGMTVMLLSLILAMVGLYAVTAHGVNLRTREIGVRMALGARPLQVVLVILRSVRVPLILGSLLGLVGAVAWDRAFTSGLVDEYAADPKALLTIVSLLAAVVGIACLVPARRATRMNPVTALRHD